MKSRIRNGNRSISVQRPQTSKNDGKQNINEYAHLMKSRPQGNYDVNWVLDLRRKSEQKLRGSIPGPPSFYEKDLQKYTERAQSRGNGDNSVDFLKKLSPRPYHRSTFKFARSLRSSTPGSQVKRESIGWNRSPYREDTSPVHQPRTISKFKQLRERYKKSPSKIYKSIDDRTEHAFEGDHSVMPSYNDSITRQHTHKFRHLLAGSAKQSTLSWCMNLRS